MVVTTIMEQDDASSTLISDNKSLTTQCVLSTFMRPMHRTTSPDSILLLKLPESQPKLESPAPGLTEVTPPRKRPPSDHRQQDSSSRKRPSSEHREEEDQAQHFPKKARIIILPPAGTEVRRTVHFELQDASGSDTIKSHVRVFERVEADNIGNIWWSGNEMMEIHAREKSAVSVMSFCCDHYTTEVLNLMRLARDKTALPGTATSESSSPVWVANSPARGLERDIVQGFKQRKRQVIRRVLESQRVLKNGKHHATGERPSPELRVELLSSQYQKWSHPSARFAQVLAEGDAQIVVDFASDPASSLDAFARDETGMY